MYRLLAIALSAIGLMALLAVAIPRPNADAPVVAASAAADSDGAGNAYVTVIRRDSSGQFHTTALVNGQDTRFLVDTGADMVALTEEDAEALGISVDPDSFVPMLQTASGPGYGARVTPDSLALGETEFTQVPAVVVRGLGVNLLGQSVLGKLGKVELQGDEMVIRH